MMSKVAILLTTALLACGAKPQTPATTPVNPATTTGKAPGALRIRLATIYVDDQDKALRFYTEVLGFAKHADVRSGPYRWLTVTSPGDADGAELQLAANDNPAGKAYQQALLAQGQPAAMLFTDDVQGAYARIKAQGAEFTMPPTDVTGSTITMVKDTCGNLLQLTQLR